MATTNDRRQPAAWQFGSKFAHGACAPGQAEARAAFDADETPATPVKKVTGAVAVQTCVVCGRRLSEQADPATSR